MRPTAEGMEEENRNKPKTETPETPAATKPAEVHQAAPAPEEPAALSTEIVAEATPALQPDWYVEPTSPPPAPVFMESEAMLPVPSALPPDEPHFAEDEPFEDEEGEPEEMEASDAEREEREEKEGESESKSESRKRRSRGRRGGKRRNGRSAASTTAGAEPAADEEDDEDDFEAAHEEPAPPPSPAPRRFAPAPTPAPAPQYRVSRGSDSYVIPTGPMGENEPMTREIIISVPDRQRAADTERKIALFCDFENIALGVRDSDIGKFDITIVLERLLEKGKIIVKKAYADWERYSDYKRTFHEAAIELIDIPQKFYSGKNSADIKMVVDAMDLSYSKEHLDTFVILSGDSDFSPLVSKLKENNKYVIGIGVKNSSSNLLVDNCDEFIYYEDVWRDSQKGPKLDGLNKKTAEAFSLMIESIQALIRENKDVLWGSMIKQTMQRKKPSFNEGYYGYSTFSELLEDAERKQIIKLKKDQRSGTYIVTGFAKTGEGVTAVGRR
jgi:uncharacterized protein (TIGR00288 family)